MKQAKLSEKENKKVGERLTIGLTPCEDCEISGSGHRTMYCIYRPTRDKTLCENCLDHYNYKAENGEVFSE